MPSKKYTAQQREEMRQKKQKQDKPSILKPFLIILVAIVVVVAVVYVGLPFLGSDSTVVVEENNAPSLTKDYTVLKLNSTGSSIDVLGNDEDLDEDDLNITSIGNPLNGIAEIIENEVFYTPDTNFTGIESFSYTVSDGEDEVSSTVNVVVADEYPIALMDTSKGMIILELYTDKVPTTANNFINLSKSDFYNGIIFHRVMPDFMIQGGDPNGDGSGGPGYSIPDEFHEDLSNVRGTISMANSGPNTGGSQFFINVVDNTYLDYDKEPLTNKHAVFGKVIYGMDVADDISEVSTDTNSKPYTDIVINSIIIENE